MYSEQSCQNAYIELYSTLNIVYLSGAHIASANGDTSATANLMEFYR